MSFLAGRTVARDRAPSGNSGPVDPAAHRTEGRVVDGVLPWALSRSVVLAVLLLARYLANHLRPFPGSSASRVHQGLLGWDAGWYQSIAQHNYGALPPGALRFFPLFPESARLLHIVSAIPTGACLLLISNGCALAAAVALARLTDAEVRRRANLSKSPETAGGSPSADGRGNGTTDSSPAAGTTAAWLLCLAPPAYVLAMGYADAPTILLAILAFGFLRNRRWGWAAVVSLLAGLCRPVGILLALPAGVEVVRAFLDRPGPGVGPVHSRTAWRERAGQAAAVLAAPAGAVAYLAWVAARFGDFWLPLRVQTEPGHRGGLRDPFSTAWHDLVQLFHGRHFGTDLHLPWLLLATALAVATWYLLPASFSIYATATLLLAASSANWDSFERYALGAFPLVMSGALLARGARTRWAVLSLSSAALAGYSLLAFLGLSVP